MITSLISIAVALGSFIYTANVVWNFTIFLSSSNDQHKSYNEDEKSAVMILFSIFVDACLLSGFVIQHSFMANFKLLNLLSIFNLESLERSLYNATTSAVLSFTMTYWCRVPQAALWNIDTDSSPLAFWIFAGTHLFSWFIIYSGCIMMDISELMGLKQVYYDISSRVTPMSVKSIELKRFYRHMRHPSFTGFFLILWVHPFMTYDRMLLATLLTVYMSLRWALDNQDYNYHSSTVRMKKLHHS